MAINNIPLSLEEDVKLQGYKSKLAALRQDGVTKLADTKQLIYTTKKSKMLSQEAKEIVSLSMITVGIISFHGYPLGISQEALFPSLIKNLLSIQITSLNYLNYPFRM